MAQPHPPGVKVQDLFQSLYDHQRLVALVKTMAQEIERLDNDNMQLRAAITLYREALRRERRTKPPDRSIKYA